MLYQFEFIILYFDNGRNLGVVFQLKIGHNCIVMLKVICDEDSARVFYPFFLFFFLWRRAKLESHLGIVRPEVTFLGAKQLK